MVCTQGRNSRLGAQDSQSDSCIGPRSSGCQRFIGAGRMSSPIENRFVIGRKHLSLSIITSIEEGHLPFSRCRKLYRPRACLHGQHDGNIVFLGFALAGVPGLSASRCLTALVAFFIGASIGGRLAKTLAPLSSNRWKMIAFGSEALFLLGATPARLRLRPTSL